MKRLEEQTETRNINAAYLKSQIKDIPGILPYELNPGVIRAAFHLFPFRYKKDEFKGLTKGEFLKALQSEGIPCMGGYTPLNKMPYLENVLKTKNFKLMYPASMLDYKKYMERNQCPANDQLCEEAVWFFHSMLLAGKSDMDDIAMAIEKIHKNAEKIKGKILFQGIVIYTLRCQMRVQRFDRFVQLRHLSHTLRAAIGLLQHFLQQNE